MSEIKIETITSVHIGSGNFLHYNTDFVHDPKQQKLFVIDDRKVLNAIGEENLDNWVLSIERGENTQDFVQRCNPKVPITDYSKREMEVYGRVNPNDTLKEHIHDGMGRIYIPGSSIKGAIRSAVLATCVHQIEHLETKIFSKGNKVSSSTIEEELFGKMQNDVFRFLQVGDAVFPKNSEIAIRLNMGLNITQKEELDYPKDQKPQVTEVIRPEEGTSFHMKIDPRISTRSSAPDCMLSLEKLFAAINAHTRSLIIKEMKFWQALNEDHTGADDYIDQLKYTLNDIDSCNEKQCILRIGHGSGWDFMTGGWAKALDNFAEVIVPASRPKNYNYQEYPFPKSRRLDSDSEMLGFVKLSFK